MFCQCKDLKFIVDFKMLIILPYYKYFIMHTNVLKIRCSIFFSMDILLHFDGMFILDEETSDPDAHIFFCPLSPRKSPHFPRCPSLRLRLSRDDAAGDALPSSSRAPRVSRARDDDLPPDAVFGLVPGSPGSGGRHPQVLPPRRRGPPEAAEGAPAAPPPRTDDDLPFVADVSPSP